MTDRTERIQYAAVRARAHHTIDQSDVTRLRVAAEDMGVLPVGVVSFTTDTVEVRIVLSPTQLRAFADGVAAAAEQVDAWDAGEVVA